ncbi:heme ABC transporter ATP-binding protein [Morganella morganii]|uniref:Heme ABC transporter ATP-binding protein n=1 Tax=Morganella morganii TaxID=582 RepID=A0A9Q4GUY8_MORMO|nr:heme ABC transporter ATP-binding protein [Morganella morganii]MCY0791415.1 heme ABC transporter ATP-binding protein [Morganella morganii]
MSRITPNTLPPVLDAENICFSRGGQPVISDISLTLHCGTVTTISGPNGAGKSTLLRLLSGYYPCDSGQILLRGKPISSWSSEALAQIRAVMTQQSVISAPFLVRDIIALGDLCSPFTRRETIDEVIHLTACESLLEKRWYQLSGGEQQRVHLARALMQLNPCLPIPRLLLLDEPTSALDLHHQQRLMRMLKKRVSTTSLAVCCILHDLNLASLYADHIIMLDNGRVISRGTPADVLQQSVLTETYQVNLITLRHPLTGNNAVLLAP